MSETTNTEIVVPGLYRHGFLMVLDGAMYVTLPERVRFVQLPDNVLYIAGGGEYLFMVAQQAYGRIYDTCLHLAEVIAQFQPVPILDISVPLVAGQKVYLPPSEFIDGDVYGESMAEAPEIS